MPSTLLQTNQCSVYVTETKSTLFLHNISAVALHWDWCPLSDCYLLFSDSSPRFFWASMHPFFCPTCRCGGTSVYLSDQMLDLPVPAFTEPRCCGNLSF